MCILCNFSDIGAADTGHIKGYLTWRQFFVDGKIDVPHRR